MKAQSGRLTRRRKFFARLYDDNSEWRKDHQDTLSVFHKIATETRKGKSIDRIIALLFANKRWAKRMAKKKPTNWKRSFLRWKKNARHKTRFGDKAQVEKHRFHPCKHWAKRKTKNLFRYS